jgi:hypothetical protein
VKEETAFSAIVVCVVVALGIGTAYFPAGGSATNSRSSDTYFTSSCSITGIGGLELQVVSDSTGYAVAGAAVSAVDMLGCGGENQIVYVDNFTASTGGWLTPVFPSQAVPGGVLSFSVVYQGKTYTFTSEIVPVGTNCVTLHVPSGSVTTSTVMNGNGSYCS